MCVLVCVCGPNFTDSWQGPLADLCENGNALSGSIRSCKFRYHTDDQQLLRKDNDPRK
jgi:hypothetical protein